MMSEAIVGGVMNSPQHPQLPPRGVGDLQPLVLTVPLPFSFSFGIDIKILFFFCLLLRFSDDFFQIKPDISLFDQLVPKNYSFQIFLKQYPKEEEKLCGCLP